MQDTTRTAKYFTIGSLHKEGASAITSVPIQIPCVLNPLQVNYGQVFALATNSLFYFYPLDASQSAAGQSIPICILPAYSSLSTVCPTINCALPQSPFAGQFGLGQCSTDQFIRPLLKRSGKKLKGMKDEGVPRSFMRRNICKAILRRISQVTKKDLPNTIKLAKEAGCKSSLIEYAFFDVYERKEAYERAQVVVEKVLEEKTVHTFLLRDILSKMLEELKDGDNGRIKGKNLEAYKRVCKYYYDRAVEVLASEV